MENDKSVIIKTNIYVSGFKIGNCVFQTPELKFKKIECGGAAGEYDIAYGAIEKLEASAKINITNYALYQALAITNHTPITFAKALDTGTGVKGRRDVLRGVVDIKENESKAGEVYELELGISVNYWLKEFNGLPLVEIDKRKDIVRIAGVDILEDARKAVGA